MKILWLSHFIPYPPKGGVLQRGYHLLKQTAAHHEVHLLAFNQKELIAPLFDTPEQGIKEAKSHLGNYCSTVEFIPLPLDKSAVKKKLVALTSLVRPAPYTMNWLNSDLYTASLIKLLNQHDFDFIHFDTISLAPYKKYCSNIPTSLDHHNIESHMLLRRASKESNWLKRFYFYQEGIRLEKFERRLCPKFDFNFTCSDTDTKRLLEIAKDSKVHTIPNGVDTSYFDPNPALEKRDRLIFVGTLSWYPNIEAVIFIAEQLWPEIKKIYPDICIDIIGANPPKEILELAKHDPTFKVHGFVDDILPYLKTAKCYICPIKDGGGTKLKIIDALSIGMAIVADEIACEGIDVVDNKSVIFASSPQEYLKAISGVLSDDKLRLNMEKKAREVAEKKYSYGIIGKQLADLFNHYRKEQ